MSSIKSTAQVFRTCGVDISLPSVDLPDEITITHPIQEGDRYNKEQDQDITIVIGETNIVGRKSILSARIDFFHNFFASNPVMNGEIDISSTMCVFDPTACENILNYGNTGHLIITMSNVYNLLKVADFLGIDSVMEECAQFIRKRLSLDNITSHLFFARSNNYPELENYVLRFIDKNFVPFSFTPVFLDLSIADLAALIRRNTLRVDDETQVFEAVTRWIGKDPGRKLHSATLLKCIRCTRLPLTFINNIVVEEEWVKEEPSCIALVNEAKEFIVSDDIRRESETFNTRERLCYDTQYLILSISDHIFDEDSDEHNTQLQIYNPLTDKWTECEDHQLSDHIYHCTYFIDGKIYFTRSSDQFDSIHELFKTSEILDTVSNEWHSKTEAIEKNKPNISGWPIMSNLLAAVAEIDRKIYVAGGENGYGNVLDNLETYDEKLQEWISLTRMTKPRAGAGCCTLHGKIYVIGGHDFDNNFLNDGEYYDPKTDRYKKRMDSNCTDDNEEKSSYNSITQWIDLCYWRAEGDIILNTVERYDPANDSWKSLKSISVPRVFHFCDISCGKLFVFGGMYERDEESRTDSVEMYDPETDIWEKRNPLFSGSSSCVSITIPASFYSSPANLEAIWITGFRNFKLKEDLLRALVEHNFMHPFEVQFECIPIAINGKDLICQAESRTGKTSTFVISTLQNLDPIDGETSVLVVCSTREKASEIQKEYEKFARYLPLVKVASFVGGGPIKTDVEILVNDSPHIIIGTSTRILRLFQSGSLKLDKIKQFIADDCTTKTAIAKIFESIRHKKQSMIFTVPLPKKLIKYCEKFVQEDYVIFPIR